MENIDKILNIKKRLENAQSDPDLDARIRELLGEASQLIEEMLMQGAIEYYEGKADGMEQFARILFRSQE